MLNNTTVYKNVLKEILAHPCSENEHDISHELIGVQIKFNPSEIIQGSSKSYIEHELMWYDSMDLNIQGHDGIEDNPIWVGCATKEGNVNSNYGWCIYHDDNYNQFNRAAREIINDHDTKRAVMIYSRPSIHIEQNDHIHARRDMICTIYTNTFLRNGELIHLVHMRSNDAWHGLRNDLAWQQTVLSRLVSKLNNNGVPCKAGTIIWNADSLHIYRSSLNKISKYLEGGTND